MLVAVVMAVVAVVGMVMIAVVVVVVLVIDASRGITSHRRSSAWVLKWM